MQDKRGFTAVFLGIGNRVTAVCFQQLVHADRPVQSLQEAKLGFLNRRPRGVDRNARHRHMKYDHMVQAKLFLLYEKVVYETGLGKVVREDKVRQLFAADGLGDLIREQGAVGRYERYVCAHRIQPVYRRQDLCGGRSEQADTGAVFARHAEGREHRSIAFPLAEHQPVGVFPGAVLYGGPVQIADLGVGDVADVFPRFLPHRDPFSELCLCGDTVHTDVERPLCKSLLVFYNKGNGAVNRRRTIRLHFFGF